MTLGSITGVVAGLALSVAGLQAGQAASPQAKPEAAPTAATFAGKWNVNVETPQGAMQSGLELKVDDKDPRKLRGTLASQMGEAVVEGEVADGKLVFWISMNAGGTELSLTFTGTPQKDGSLAGVLSFGQGEMAWTATRVKQ